MEVLLEDVVDQILKFVRDDDARFRASCRRLQVPSADHQPARREKCPCLMSGMRIRLTTVYMDVDNVPRTLSVPSERMPRVFILQRAAPQSDSCSLSVINSSGSVNSIQGTSYSRTSPIEDVCVDLGSLHAGMTQQFLHGSNVVSRFQQVRGERVPEDVRCHGLRQTCSNRRHAHRPLNDRRMHVNPVLQTRLYIDEMTRCREHPLPGPTAIGIRVFAGQRVIGRNSSCVLRKEPADPERVGLRRAHAVVAGSEHPPPPVQVQLITGV